MCLTGVDETTANNNGTNNNTTTNSNSTENQHNNGCNDRNNEAATKNNSSQHKNSWNVVDGNSLDSSRLAKTAVRLRDPVTPDSLYSLSRGSKSSCQFSSENSTPSSANQSQAVSPLDSLYSSAANSGSSCDEAGNSSPSVGQVSRRLLNFQRRNQHSRFCWDFDDSRPPQQDRLEDSKAFTSRPVGLENVQRTSPGPERHSSRSYRSSSSESGSKSDRQQPRRSRGRSVGGGPKSGLASDRKVGGTTLSVGALPAPASVPAPLSWSQQQRSGPPSASEDRHRPPAVVNLWQETKFTRRLAWRNHHEVFPNKPRYLNMTSVLTLPSHMSGFLHELGSQSGVYSFVSKPTMVVSNKPKLRSEQDNGATGNLMFDKRVIRGNTYSSNAVKQQVHATDGIFLRKGTRSKRNGSLFGQNPRKTDKKRAGMLPDIGEKYMKFNGGVPSPRFSDRTSNDFLSPRLTAGGGGRFAGGKFGGTQPPPNGILANHRRLLPGQNGGIGYKIAAPAPVQGHKHLQLQTEKWLQELSDKVQESEAGVQTEPYSSPIPSPRVESSASSGIDKETQIYANDPDLFDFEKEVGFVLEAVIGRTLEQGLLEVLEEEEANYSRRLKLDHTDKMAAMSI